MAPFIPDCAWIYSQNGVSRRCVQINDGWIQEIWIDFNSVAKKTGFGTGSIYSNEHDPIHVHVRYGGGEAIFNIGDIIELRESVGLKVKELSKAEELAKSHKDIIVKAWNEHINRQS